MKTAFNLELMLLITTFSFVACSAPQYQHEGSLDRTQSMRVAVLPFIRLNGAEDIIKPGEDEPGTSLPVDRVPLLSTPLEQSPEEIIRDQVFQALSRTKLDLVSPTLIEDQFIHHNYTVNGGLDIARIYRTPPQELVELLECDALLYGTLVRWDREYYGLETVNEIELELKLVSGEGKTLYTAHASDNSSRGLSKIPTGFVSIVTGPLRGLDSKIIADLSRRMVEKMLSPLFVENRPAYLKTPPPAIYGATALVPTGNTIMPEQGLTVMLVGTPGLHASFSIDDVIKRVPMTERQSGHYLGKYYPLPSDHFINQPVTVYIRDKDGRETSQQLSVPPLSLLQPPGGI